MQLWVTSFILLLAVVEGCKWLAQVTLPWPALLLGGALIAVISNERSFWERPLFTFSARQAAQSDSPNRQPPPQKICNQAQN